MNNECNLTLNAALQRIKNIGVDFNTLIDVGASDGRWSRNALNLWSHINLVMFEPNECHHPALKSFAHSYAAASGRAARVVPRVCSSSPGALVSFDDSDPWGGRVLPTDDNNLREAASIDCEALHFSGPFAIKLDVHGHEFACLDGARETLKSTNLVIIEVYMHDIDGHCAPLFFDIVEYMESFGFRPIDVFDFMTRPKDGTLWQFDMAFIPGNHPTFSKIGYQ